MSDDEARFKAIIQQEIIPVVIRSAQKGMKLRVRLPYSIDNRKWLSSIGRSSPSWIEKGKRWELPKSWFNKFVEASLQRYDKLYVIQPYREQEICARKCMEARGHDCNCSCMGANHGSGFHGSWFEVSDTFATNWKGSDYACRLMSVVQRE